MGFLSLLPVLLPTLTACATNSDDFCSAECDCEGCAPGGYDECLGDFVEDESASDRLGCDDLWQDYAACVASGAGCFDGDADELCGPEETSWEVCMGDEH